MNIKILFDQKVASRKYARGWGFAALVDDRVLFDTGCDGKRLLKNLGEMKINIRKINAIVISHNHQDHWGGLKALLKKCRGIPVWLGPNGFEKSGFRRRLPAGSVIHYPGRFTSVTEDVLTTGEIEGRYKFKDMPEQSLVLKTSKGLVILTGCAHPGILTILRTVREVFRERIYLVLGGFHLYRKHRTTVRNIVRNFKKMKVRKVAPCHCAGDTAMGMFRKAYRENFVEIAVGISFDI